MNLSRNDLVSRSPTVSGKVSTEYFVYEACKHTRYKSLRLILHVDVCNWNP